ncbi:MAG TPA: aminotransferase class V-fold PLP-dependent enzyme [Candidatus Baltobacteraceae bacterium]|nr:aminotransferase class V-fold PLP-dependent enzyme [Candidatus Baltobacteraceae bacterium]
MSTPLPRSEFAVTERLTYFNHAAVGVLPVSTRNALEAFLRAQAEGGVMGTYTYEANMPHYRERIGAFIGASGDEIAILRNTGDGANAIALGINWQHGDELILCDNEFPSNAIPWLALRERGVNVRLLPSGAGRLTPEALRRVITPRTRVVTVSWVGYADGYRHDLAGLAEVSHRAGAMFCVDAIQGLGAFPLDVRALGIDALYAGGAKWLLALQGVSFLYLQANALDRLSLGMPGWRSLEDMWDFENYDQPYVSNASRFEGGTPNFLGALSLDRSIDVIEKAGTRAIGEHVLALTDRLVDGLERLGAVVLSERGDGISSGIVTFRVPQYESVPLGKALQREGVITTWRPNGIRVAPHGYNSVEEIDRLLDLIPGALRSLSSP